MIESIMYSKDLLGYRIDGKCYRLRDIKNLNITISPLSSVHCIRVSGKYMIEDGSVVVWSQLRTSDTYRDLLHRLYTNNIKIKDIFIKKVTSKSLVQLRDDYEMSSYWGSRNKDCYEILSPSGGTIGLIKYSCLDDNIHISMIDVVKKKSGYGRLIINKLKFMYKLPITGYSCVDAKGFWLKVGAIFTTDYDFVINI